MNQVKELSFVKGYNRQVNLGYFPNFLILGPQRTGTTWLHKNIQSHPQIFLSTPKEIYYFNLLDQPEHPFYQSDDLKWYLRFFHESPKSLLKKNISTLKKYGEFYSPKMKGEATASYAALEPKIIEEITLLNPDIKGILMIRNPIERAWSHAKKDLLRGKNKKLSDLSQEEVREFLLDSYQLSCGHYTVMIDNWSAYLKQGNLFVGFFEELQQQPQQFLLKVFQFLGVRSHKKYLSPFIEQSVNPTQNIEIPEEFGLLLSRTFQEELESLDERFGKEKISFCLNKAKRQ